MNLYEYVKSNPINFVDPLGLFFFNYHKYRSDARDVAVEKAWSKQQKREKTLQLGQKHSTSCNRVYGDPDHCCKECFQVTNWHCETEIYDEDSEEIWDRGKVYAEEGSVYDKGLYSEQQYLTSNGRGKMPKRWTGRLPSYISDVSFPGSVEIAPAHKPSGPGNLHVIVFEVMRAYKAQKQLKGWVKAKITCHGKVSFSCKLASGNVRKCGSYDFTDVFKSGKVRYKEDVGGLVDRYFPTNYTEFLIEPTLGAGAYPLFKGPLSTGKVY